MTLKRNDLHPYQEYAVKFILENPLSALFLPCGMGKSVSALTAIQDLMHNCFEVQKVLIVCPVRVGLTVWRQESEKWEHLNILKCAVGIGTEQERLDAFNTKADIYIINRENLAWFVEDSGIFHKMRFDTIIIDESSSFKNHQTKRFRALMKLRPYAKRIILLSATSAANNLIDLWAQFRFLDMGQRLGRFIGRYRADYFVPDKRNGQVIYSYKPLSNAEAEIYRRIGDITISMKASDHLQMPELLTVEHKAELSEKERKKYDELKRELALTLGEGEVTAANAAVLSGKLCQMANGAIYGDGGEIHYIHDRKLDILEGLLEGCLVSGNVLIAYWFRHDLERIKERLRKLHIPFSQLDSSESIARWNQGELPVALIHPASAGHGLNLQSGGSTIIWFRLTW